MASAYTFPKSVKEYMTKYNLQFNDVANNIVYCLTNHKNKNAGTKLLKLCRQDAIKWWHERYGDILKAFQTFILPPRTGAVYKADNWEEIGRTTGSSQKTKNIRPNDIEKYDNVQKTTFSDGRVEYCVRLKNKVDPKIIFMKINKNKEIDKLLNINN